MNQVESALDSEDEIRVHGFGGYGNGDMEYLLLAHLAKSMWQKHGRRLIVLYKSRARLQQGLEKYRGFRRSESFLEPLTLPETDPWGHERFVSQQRYRQQRIQALSSLIHARGPLIFATPQGLLQRTLDKDAYLAMECVLQVGMEMETTSLKDRLEDLSYQYTERVENPGEFSSRGGILDIFPAGSMEPVRMEFFGDEIASIRSFDAKSQLTNDTLEKVVIGPREEFILAKKSRSKTHQKLYEYLMAQEVLREDREGFLEAFFDGYLFPELFAFAPFFREKEALGADFLEREDILFFMDPKDSLKDSYEEFYAKAMERFEKDREAKRPTFSPSGHFAPLSALEEKSAVFKKIMFSEPRVEGSGHDVSFEVSFFQELSKIKALTKISDRFPKWVDYWQQKLLKDYQILLVCPTKNVLERIGHLLANRNMNYLVLKDIFALRDDMLPSGVYLTRGYLGGCVDVAKDKLLLISSEEVLAVKVSTPQNDSKKLQALMESFSDLVKGDYVVHMHHGIGQFLGMETMGSAGAKTDFLKLEYGGGDKLYLPIDRLSLLQKYKSGDDKKRPELDRLQGQGWNRRKAKAAGAAREIAEELLKAKAKRKLAKGHAFGAPGELYYEFETGFPFDETDDQLKAIDDVNHDLSLPCPMDRLVCGDVGFGKTEIALRASMRVVADGFQVMVVVPTTILCFQHFRTFKERFSSFGVEVEYVSRFVPQKKMKETLRLFSQGKIDILIGTHRILSKDVKSHNLGLLVVDEEQRFGVSQKEIIKGLSDGVDLLTLTATPIPRTLHMSILGLKDISLLMTPPKRRLPVKTFVSPFDDTMVKEAILLEIQRKGQVFYLHNRVEDINQVAANLQLLVPQATIQVAHGQMTAAALEKVMMAFMQCECSVLVCTTIIESGLDLPNVNTMIVPQADFFGLAQLYQIKGRVGRGHLQAYCYFLYGKKRRLSDISRKRLDVLTTHQELGAGFQIAGHDLEIRGAGSLIGAEQSGHIEGVGFEVFTRMLSTAVAEYDGDGTGRERVDTEIKIPLSASIPEDYIEDDKERMRLYRRLFYMEKVEDIRLLAKEVADRFGRIPSEFLRVFLVAELKLYLRPLGAKWLSGGAIGFYEMQLLGLSQKEMVRLKSYIKAHASQFTLVPPSKVMINLAAQHSTKGEEQDKILGELIKLMKPLSEAVMEG